MDDNGPTRKTYLRNGGNNLEILARLAQMENETGSLKNARSLPKIDRQKKEKDSMQNQLALTRYQFEKQLADLEEKVLRKKLKSKLEKKLRQLESDDYSEVNELPMPGLPELLRLQHLNSDYYNPTEGFVILYDYVTGLDAETTAVKLVARLELVNQENGTTLPGPPSILFAVNFVSDSSRPSSKLAIMAVRQPVAQCEADANMVLVVEVHTAWAGQQLVSQGQCTARLFSNSGNLLSGCWRMTVLPPDSAISQQMIQDSIEVCFRLTSPLIAESEAVLPQPTIPLSEFYQPHQTNSIFEIEDAPEGHQSSIDRLPADEVPIETVGLSIDRLKDAEDAPMKIRLTAYHASTGQILQSSRGPVTCTTPSISITYKNRYHMFGQLQAVFPGVQINNELLLVARVYSTNVGHDSDRSSIKRHSNVAPSGDEGLVAWASFSLILPNKKGAYSINVGDHVKTLYCPPVPDIPALRNWRKEYGEAYFNASIRIQIFTGSSHPNSPTPSEISDDLNAPSTWILNERTVPPREPFKATDGFDLYIDGCRYLPDAVQITRISAKILDRQYTAVGRHMNVIAKIGSDIYNPVFDYRVEFREPNMAATSTLLIKIYTSDEKCEKLITLGYSVLNIFVETGTLRQPITDRGAQVSLNEGSHQLRIHHNFGSDDPGPMSVNCLSKCRLIPGASILVRLVKAPVGPDGWPLEADSLPYSDWQKLGLLKQRPSYDSGVYFSETCRPTQEEKVLMSDLDKRTGISVKEVALTKLAEPGDTKKYQSDNEIEQFIRMKLTQLMDKKPIDIDLKFVSEYNPKHGIKLAIDAAYNIPWSNFTLAHVCLNPPGSLYLVPDEKTGTAFDKPYFFGNLDLNSTCQMPVWEDKYFHFDNRSYHPHLIAIIHLREVEIKSTEDSYRYTLLDEAWTVIEIFTDRYANTSNFQLPLIHGSPKPEWIKQMQTESLTQWLSKNTRTKKIELMPSTSITVRLCDGRRNKELPHSSTDGVILNTEYIPAIEGSRSSYEKRPAGGKQLSSMVPRGKTPNEFLYSLSVMFKQLVYKYYLEGDKEGTSVGQ